jgi:hypothetical protein
MGISDDDKFDRRSTTATHSHGEANHGKLADEATLLWHQRGAANG